MYTANEEKEFNASIGRKRYERIHDSDVYKMIRSVEERQQMLNHCSIWDLSTGIHIVGDKQANVIQATIIDFDLELLSSYIEVIDDMKEEYISWAYSNDDVPEEVVNVAKTIGMVVIPVFQCDLAVLSHNIFS